MDEPTRLRNRVEQLEAQLAAIEKGDGGCWPYCPARRECVARIRRLEDEVLRLKGKKHG